MDGLFDGRSCVGGRVTAFCSRRVQAERADATKGLQRRKESQRRRRGGGVVWWKERKWSVVRKAEMNERLGVGGVGSARAV